MTKRILEILDNVRYWDTCPDEYKKDIETFLEVQNQALCIHDVVGRSEQLKALLEKLLNENMCSVAGDELIEEALKGF
jgi:hypothetical protein